MIDKDEEILSEILNQIYDGIFGEYNTCDRIGKIEKSEYLLTPDQIERIKEINKKLQDEILAGEPVDDIGPLDITIDNVLYDYREQYTKRLEDC